MSVWSAILLKLFGQILLGLVLVTDRETDIKELTVFIQDGHLEKSYFELQSKIIYPHELLGKF